VKIKGGRRYTVNRRCLTCFVAMVNYSNEGLPQHSQIEQNKKKNEQEPFSKWVTPEEAAQSLNVPCVARSKKTRTET
jgi:hypothetical protein